MAGMNWIEFCDEIYLVIDNGMFTVKIKEDRIDIDKPLWSQDTFIGRFKHFAFITDPRTCMTSDEDLDKAKLLVQQYR